MKFAINNQNWEIKKASKKFLVDWYNDTHEERVDYVYGYCHYPQHIIYLNKELNDEELLRTVKHELAHCWLWATGAYGGYDTFTEEELCDRVSAMNDFVYETSKVYMEVKAGAAFRN